VSYVLRSSSSIFQRNCDSCRNLGKWGRVNYCDLQLNELHLWLNPSFLLNALLTKFTRSRYELVIALSLASYQDRDLFKMDLALICLLSSIANRFKCSLSSCIAVDEWNLHPHPAPISYLPLVIVKRFD
jgi:hypothetical protein